MSAEQWTGFWTYVLAIGSGGFALLSLVVAVGGFRDVKVMFRRIDAERDEVQRGSAGPDETSGQDELRS